MADEWKTPAIWTPQRTQAVATRFVSAYQRTPENLLAHGREFYPTWHEDAHHIGTVTGLGHEAGAAILAHLSPANEAERNRIQAMQLVHGVDDKQAGMLLRAAKASSAAKSAEVRLRGAATGSRFHTELAAEYAGQSAKNEQLRRRAGIVGTPLEQATSGAIGKALRVRQGSVDPIESLGRMKLRDFGGQIADPYGYHRVAIDTHMHDIGVGRMDIPYKTKRGLEGVSRYEAFQTAHGVAHMKAQHLMGEEIPLSEFMAGTWFGHQQRKVNANPDAMKARRATSTQMARMRASEAAQPYLPERYGLRPAFGKIDIGR
jgi:hypothetical protein